jgi:choline-sulfatase
MKPNFLILMVDQMAGPLLDSDMIEHLHIPNMKKLIARGVKFNNCYTPSPLCTPSRGSFMTGMLPSRNGIYDNAAEFKSTTPSYAHYLRAEGYQTALAGKMHFIGADQLHGFEERLTTDIYPADFGWTPNWDKPDERIDWWYHNLSTVTGAGVAEISNQLEFDDEVAYTARLQLYRYARRIDTRPFALCVSFTHPHDPYITRRKYWDLYEHNQIPMPKIKDLGFDNQDPHSKRIYEANDYRRFDIQEEHIRSARHAYFANISYLDEKIGELLDVLDECEFADNTHILLCADHGDMLGERGLWYKMTFFEYAARIPLVLTSPGNTEAREVDAPVTNCDILPSLIELAGGDPTQLAAPIDGTSFVGLAIGADETERRAYAEYCAEGSAGPMVMIRDRQYKFNFSTTEAPQLFDLVNDPNELTNIATDPAHAETLASFMEELNRHWDMEKFRDEVLLSQRSRRLVDSANRMGRFESWDYSPPTNARDRFMRNHLDLNVLETNNRFPKEG